ncbi:MAG: ORF6N domain-containing protein [Candidatus Margulisbacteria bacterium]|jgi:hypothetical protein|nr:ORF6N domain-containing protein [Candidatus Margulisiibacteriota bacterium]
MSNVVPYADVEKKIITVRGQNVLLDSDVAELYGVETKRVNEALKNNPDKFPQGYVWGLTDTEMQPLRSKLSTLEKGRGKYSKYNANVFTEKGLYMLATILKSPRAAKTTIAIVETFVKLRELSRSVSELSETSDKSRQKSLMQKSGEIFADILDNNLQIAGTETSFEINLALVKFKHTVKQKRKKR